MLSENEKDKIEAEEIFRHEVRLELQNKRSPSSSSNVILSFLNTPFGLWLLSTVVVGLLVWSYSKYDQVQQSKTESRQLVRKIDIEIAHRLNEFMLQIELSSSSSTDSLRAIINLIERPSPMSNIFPEYKDRNLVSLLWELEKLVPEEEKSKLYWALDNVKNIRQKYMEHAAGHEQYSMSLVDYVMSDLGNVVDARWLTSGFYYFNFNRWQSSPNRP